MRKRERISMPRRERERESVNARERERGRFGGASMLRKRGKENR